MAAMGYPEIQFFALEWQQMVSKYDFDSKSAF